MTKRQGEVGDAELEVLKALWEHGPATVREVMNLLHGAGRQLAYTTVLTFLTRLEQKGYASSNKSGLAYVYRAKLSRERVVRSRVRSVIEQLFDGAPGPLVLQLMQTEEFSRDELSELRRILDTLGEEDTLGGADSPAEAGRAGTRAARRGGRPGNSGTKRDR